ncbi:MAG: ribbon-helix-helix protein, CopG family [Dehalococcoidales bacterium]|nr:ribbon-helix-helix protein, CopG family [Dehalococcoidales bacterium]
MGKSTKVAISLPESVLKDIEKKREISGESRSEFFRRAVEELLKKEKEAAAIDQYIRGYREMPESAEETAATQRIAAESLAEEPWE